MSFSTYKKKIKTVGELKKYLEDIPDGVSIVTKNEIEDSGWCTPYFYYDADYFDAWTEGDKVKMTKDGKEIWISVLCIDNEAEDYELED